MMTVPTIKTERLTLRAFTKDDTAVMIQIMNGKDVLRYFPPTTPPDETRVAKMIENILLRWAEFGYGLWAVENTTTHELMGRCGLQFISETAEVEVDFILGRSYWGQGFATEAGKAALQFGFRQFDFDEIVGIVHPDNIASQNVLRKIGMNFTKATEYFGMAVHRYAVHRSDTISF